MKGRCQGQTALLSVQNRPFFSALNTAVAIVSAGNRERLYAYVRNLVVLYQLKKQKQWCTGVSYKSGLSCGQK